MTDISKCSGDGCPRREECWRYVAPRGAWQSMFATPPIKPDGTCEHYWPLTLRGIGISAGEV